MLATTLVVLGRAEGAALARLRRDLAAVDRWSSRPIALCRRVSSQRVSLGQSDGVFASTPFTAPRHLLE